MMDDVDDEPDFSIPYKGPLDESAMCGVENAGQIMKRIQEFHNNPKRHHEKIDQKIQDADNGDLQAQIYVANFYATDPIPPTHPIIFKYYKMAAEQNHRLSQHNLARCYAKGCGTDVNPELAFKYYKLSADQGYEEAKLHLGLCYKKGLGCEVNEELSELYLKQAFKQFAKLRDDHGNWLEEEQKEMEARFFAKERAAREARMKIGKDF